MQQLVFEEAGRYAWREAADPEISDAGQALVRPLMVACCDLDVGVAQGVLPVPPGHAVGHEGLAEVVAVGDDVTTVQVGDRVVVPFQISCGQCRACRRGVTGSCASLPLMAMYGMAPLAGLDGGGFMSDLVLVPYRRRDAHPRSRRRRPGRDRLAVGQHPRRLARSRARTRRSWPLSTRSIAVSSWWAGCRSACTRRRSVWPTARRSTTSTPTSSGWPMAEKLGARVHDRPKPDKAWDPYPVTVHTSADPAVLASTLRVTWPDGVCTDTGIYYQDGVEMPLLPMYTRGVRFVTGRVNARAVIPKILELLTAACDLAPAVDRVVPWEDAPSVWPTMTGKTVFTR